MNLNETIERLGEEISKLIQREKYFVLKIVITAC